MKKFLIGLIATFLSIAFSPTADAQSEHWLPGHEISAPEAKDVAKGQGQMSRAAESVSPWCHKVGGDGATLMVLRQRGLTPEDFADQVQKFYKTRPDVQRYLIALATVVFGMESLDPIDAAIAARDACERDPWPEVHP